MQLLWKEDINKIVLLKNAFISITRYELGNKIYTRSRVCVNVFPSFLPLLS